MERKEASNGLQLIKIAVTKLRGNFSALFMGAFAMVTPLFLMFGLPILMAVLSGETWIVSIGVVLFVLFVGPLQMGYIKFYNETLDGKQPRLSVVYSQIRFSVNSLKYVYMAGILFILYILGFGLWILPAGFAISFFSMILFFQERFNYKRFSDAFRDTAKNMIGSRLAMFSYKLIFYLVYALLFATIALDLVLIYVLSLESVIVSWLVSVCSVIVFIFLYTMITVYFHSCNQVFFEDVLSFNERKASKIKSKSNALDVAQTAMQSVETPNKSEPVENELKHSKKSTKMKETKDNKTKKKETEKKSK